MLIGICLFKGAHLLKFLTGKINRTCLKWELGILGDIFSNLKMFSQHLHTTLKQQPFCVGASFLYDLYMEMLKIGISNLINFPVY